MFFGFVLVFAVFNVLFSVRSLVAFHYSSELTFRVLTFSFQTLFRRDFSSFSCNPFE